jgi:quercetin dioxygenase-like cupin family protein
VKRRAFLSTAVAVVPVTAVANDGSRPGRAVQVAAGVDRNDRGSKFESGGHLECKVSGKDTHGAMAVFVALTTASDRPARHFHHEQDEWFYVIDGEYDFEVGDEKFHLNAGDSLFAPRKVPHAWACVSEKPGTLMATVQPAGTLEAFFQKLPQYVGKVRASPEEMAKLHAEHGMQVTGPPLPPRK